ncbi:MAG: DUF6062 family protein [Gallintestinimicrobium sp.]
MPFCYIERNVEQDLMDFVLGSRFCMESDVREDTDWEGFCRTHMKKCSITATPLAMAGF